MQLYYCKKSNKKIKSFMFIIPHFPYKFSFLTSHKTKTRIYQKAFTPSHIKLAFRQISCAACNCSCYRMSSVLLLNLFSYWL